MLMRRTSSSSPTPLMPPLVTPYRPPLLALSCQVSLVDSWTAVDGTDMIARLANKWRIELPLLGDVTLTGRSTHTVVVKVRHIHHTARSQGGSGVTHSSLRVLPGRCRCDTFVTPRAPREVQA
eukprot:345909-Prorocentrum_minimum.AAC.1